MKESSKNNSMVKSIIKVSISNILKILSGVLVGFLLPKMIGVKDYGLFKTFTLYGTYTGLFAVGITDGIYLKYGGYNYEQLERTRFRFFSKSYLMMEFFVSMLVLILSCFIENSDYKFIAISLSAFLTFNNITGYYQIISQISGRFNELSLRTVIQSVLTTISILILWGLQQYCNILISYRIYTVVYILISFILATWYIYTYRDITFGSVDNWGVHKNEYFLLIKVGVPLLVANLCSSFILTIDRQFVNILFDTDSYAIYAFAYNMLALITTALSAISTVIYPVMKRMDIGKLLDNYDVFISLVIIIVFGCLIVYFPLMWFVGWFLPRYTDSLVIFRIILPGMVISSSISIVIHNYYKTLNIEKKFFVKSIVILICSGLANFIAYLLFGTTVSISIASVIIMVIWYILVERSIPKDSNILRRKNYIYIVIMFFTFYLITAADNWLMPLIIYSSIYLIISIALYHKEIVKFKTISKTNI